jgi:Na+/H+ antiporter NhaC
MDSILVIVPPLLAIGIALWTQQVFLSLLFGIWVGCLILAQGHLLDGSLDTLQLLVDVFKSSGNTRTILFSALMGALIVLIQKTGGVQGFLNVIQERLDRE